MFGCPCGFEKTIIPKKGKKDKKNMMKDLGILMKKYGVCLNSEAVKNYPK